MIQAVDRAMEDFAVILTTGAYMADFFPIRKPGGIHGSRPRRTLTNAIIVCHVPEWLPGAGWKKRVAKQRETFLDMVNLPSDWVREQMVSRASHCPRMMVS